MRRLLVLLRVLLLLRVTDTMLPLAGGGLDD